MYKAKWQQLLSQHTSARSATDRFQRDLQQLQQSHADLQQVNHALESRLLRLGPATATNSPYQGPGAVASSPGMQSHGAHKGKGDKFMTKPHRSAGNSPPAEHNSGRSSTSNLDRVLAEHRGRLLPGHGQAFEHSEITAATAEGDSAPRLDSCLSSEDIMARLTKSPPGESTGAAHFWQS